MIPKIIHYCWLSGDPYPEKIQFCIDSWKRVLPDYEIVLWDKQRFNLEDNLWCKQAYENKKYAFAADYIRMYALYHYGGIYLDSDVEVFKKFDELLGLPYFIGREGIGNRVEVAAFGAEKGTEWVADCMRYYEGRSFIKEDGSLDTIVMPDIVYNIINSKYKINLIDKKEDFIFGKDVFNEFPNDWFCANVHLHTSDTKPTYIISSNTYCVHHFANSWIKVSKFKIWVKNFMIKTGIISIYNKFKE